MKYPFVWEINPNNQNPLKSSFEALNYDLVFKPSRARSDYVTVFKAVQPSFTTSKYLLKWFGENRSVLCIQNTVADPGEGPHLIFRPNWGQKRRKFFWRPLPALSKGLDDRAHPYLKVWIPHWNNITIEFMFAGINMFWARLRLILARAARRGLKISLW